MTEPFEALKRILLESCRDNTRLFAITLRLEHVLYTLNKAKKQMLVSEDGRFCRPKHCQHQVDCAPILYHPAIWELGKPLEEQSPETIQFLYDLLKTE